MSWVAVGVAVVGAVYSGMQGREATKTQQQIYDAEAEQAEMTQRAEASSTENALLETLREQNFALIDERRAGAREYAQTVAGQANTGVRGVTSRRQLNNVLFQNAQNISAIERAGDRQLRDASTQGFSRASSIQSTINSINARRSTLKPESYGSIFLKAGVSGASTYYGKKGST